MRTYVIDVGKNRAIQMIFRAMNRVRVSAAALHLLVYLGECYRIKFNSTFQVQNISLKFEAHWVHFNIFSKSLLLVIPDSNWRHDPTL